MLYWCGKRKTNIELGAGVGADFDLPDLTYTLDVLVVQFFILVSKLLIVRNRVKSMAEQPSSQELALLERVLVLS